MTTKRLSLRVLSVVLAFIVACAPVMAWVSHFNEQARFVEYVAAAGADDELVVATPEDLGLAPEPQAVVEAQPQAVLEEPLAEEPILLADAGQAVEGEALTEEPIVEEPLVEEPVLEEDQVLLADATTGPAGAAGTLPDYLFAQPGGGTGDTLGIVFGTVVAGGVIIGGTYYTFEALQNDETLRNRLLSP